MTSSEFFDFIYLRVFCFVCVRAFPFVFEGVYALYALFLGLISNIADKVMSIHFDKLHSLNFFVFVGRLYPHQGKRKSSDTLS